jgi:hypothetical protein
MTSKKKLHMDFGVNSDQGTGPRHKEIIPLVWLNKENDNFLRSDTADFK